MSRMMGAALRASRLLTLFFCFGLAVTAACTDKDPTGPSPFDPPVTSVPTTTAVLRGSVTDVDGVPLANAAVGGWDVNGYWMTDSSGRYEGPAVVVGRTITVTAEKSGFTTGSSRVTFAGHDMNFQLQRAGAAEGAPTHTLTFTASPTCSLPPEVMTRSYSARVEVTDTRVIVRASGAIFIGWGGEPGFAGVRDGDRVRFTLTDDLGADYQFIELTASNRELAIVGSADGLVTDDGMTATLAGRVTLRTWASQEPIAMCDAGDHRLVLTRQGR
jgi:hypothetical protein